LSQQYWTAYLYASIDVFQRAWDEFINNLNDDAEWDYSSHGQSEWEITRTRSLSEYGDEGYKGEMSANRYSRLSNSIERIQQELDDERQRLEEEQRRREEEERARMESARAAIISAVSNAKSSISSNEFERAEEILESQSSNYNRYKSDLDLSDYTKLTSQIDNLKRDWVNQMLLDIEQLTSQKEWDSAKDKLDSIMPERISSTNSGNQVKMLRTKLNRERKDWEEAEKERLRLEKIANELRSKKIIEQKINNWVPKINEGSLLSDLNGYDVFEKELEESTDWSFLEEHDDWSTGEGVKTLRQNAESVYHNSKLNLVAKQVTELIENGISRDNILNDETLSGEFNPLEKSEMLKVLSDGIHTHFTNIGEYIKVNSFDLTDSMVEDFTIMYVEARKSYIEEVKRAKNTELAKAMVGKLLNLQDTDDFVSMVSKSYIGEHRVRVFITESGVQKELVKPEAIVTHIEQGSDLVIVLEECYNTDQEKADGHIKNRKIFEN
jgi:hypothetical protein